MFAGKQYNVLLIFKVLINYSPLAYISLSFFVYLSSDGSGLRSPGVQGDSVMVTKKRHSDGCGPALLEMDRKVSPI